MRWSFPWSENIKKRSIRYILQRYLGQFLEEKLTLDQLTVDLYNGIGSVSNVSLDVQALNELAEQHNFPVEFVDGSIAEFKVCIPWSSLLNDSSSVEVDGLHLVIQPKQRTDNGAPMFESMWSSMTSSIQLAEECLKNTSERIPVEQTNPVNGVEEFARTIDSILTRTKLKFINTRIRLEHLPKDSVIGGALELHIKQFTYYDETSNEMSDDSPTKPASAYGVKLFSAEGVELYTSEFHASNRTMSRSLLFESAMSLNASMTESTERCQMSQDDIILFGKFLGKQEVRLKIKQKENASGPKTDVELNISTLAILASPRQLRIVCEMIAGLMSPHLQDTSNVKPHHRVHQKPMTASDYERVEHVLHQHLNPPNSDVMVKSLQNASGWSSAGRGEESDDGFRPVRGHYASSTMSDSASTSFSSSYASTASSCYHSKSSEQFGYSHPRSHTSRHKDKSSGSESDLSGDVRRFEIRLNFFTAMLLHRDIMESSDKTRLPEETSVQEMQALSDSFFAHFVQSNLHSQPGRQPTITLDQNHFRLHCSTVILNGDEKTNLSNSEVSGSLSVAKLELLECLMELDNKKEEIIELIRFMNPADVARDASAFTRPDLVAHFKFSDDSKRFAAHKRTELNVMMRHCCTEIDVTMIDRMVDILSNFQEFVTVLDKSTDAVRPGLSDVHAPAVDSKLDWKISTPFVKMKLRFPIPELKEECNDECWFWHRRNVHNDLLFVELSELSVHSEISSHQLAQTYEFQAKSVRVLFQESTAEKPVPFVFSGVDEKVGASLPNGGAGFDWPRLVLRVYPKVNYVELEDVDDRMSAGIRGMAQSIIQVGKKEPSPFSAKMVKRESDTSHANSTCDSDGEEIILPGNKEEMGEFVEAASHNALLQVDISLPSAVVVIPSKHFYELLYNRFNNDLMLWTPKASRQSHSPSDDQHNQTVHLNFGQAGAMFTSFSMCKSTLRADSESEDEDACGNLLDGDMKKSTQKQDNNATDLSQSSITVSLFVGHGVVDIFPHARDTTGNVIPEQYGEIHIMFQEANLFFVSGYKGEPLLNYLCLQMNHSTLYHCSLVPGCTENTLKHIDAYPNKYMLPTIYKTQAGGVVNESATPVGTGSTTSDDMLTLAIRVQGQENRVKNICVANSLNGVTIRHRMKLSYTSWLSQLIDFFDIKDYPISDYQPWKVVTQLHQQFLNCVIDYRPLHLPIKAALTVEDFNISSNITSKTATSILRFIAEEASLFISSKVSDDRDNPQDLSIDLRNNYVCVVEMGLFELSMRLTEKDGECEPETDLRASNNIVHIRTCADSAIALMELVKYVAGDGDLSEAQFTDECSRKGSSGSGDDLLVRIERDETEENPHIPCMGVLNTSESCVPQLVEEAMQDVPFEEPPKKKINHLRCTTKSKSNVEVFYFPNEESVSVGSSHGQTFSDSLSSDDDLDLDGGFIYVDHDMDMGPGYMGQSNNAPEIRLLTKEPVRMVDNHFTVPINKVDVLKAPKGYPQPVSKYTLREMTIVWHMYGGNDFPKGDEDSKASDTKKHVVIAPERSGSSESLYSFDSGRTVKRRSTESINIAYSAPRSGEMPSVNFVSSPSPQYSYTDLTTISPTTLHERHKNCSWQVAGGVNRIHDELMELKLQKLKYQYEIYPKDTKQASRQVLIAQEVEISDCMATSQLNKFLYQYTSSTRPKQSHANMIVIKATYIRPELNVSHRQECCLRVSMLPLRLNIDQDSLLFLINFFNEISGNKNEDDAPSGNPTGPKTAQQPVMNIEKMDPGTSAEERIPPLAGAAPVSMPIFIRSFIFVHEVLIRFDYTGKRVDMTHGPVAGMIMGLGQLNSSELRLKRLCHRHGILGFDKLISYILSEWLNDIKKNQLPSILGGVGPMHSLVQLIQGIRDLFWLPIEQYQKDGRIVRGLQRGANSFTTSTAMAALELTARLVYAIQIIAETAFDLVTPGPSFRHKYGDRPGRNDFRTGSRSRFQYRYQRPGDIREGFFGAMMLFKEGLGDTAQTLMRVASMENETKGAVGAVGGIIREMPSAALTPIILATQATSNVLDGVRSHLVPDAKTEAALKWKTDYFD